MTERSRPSGGGGVWGGGGGSPLPPKTAQGRPAHAWVELLPPRTLVHMVAATLGYCTFTAFLILRPRMHVLHSPTLVPCVVAIHVLHFSAREMLTQFLSFRPLWSAHIPCASSIVPIHALVFAPLAARATAHCQCMMDACLGRHTFASFARTAAAKLGF